jgi:hypothetical protein
MDNEAFKELVRSKVKGSKEIAREAVEEAFRKKKRKRKGRKSSGDLSSSSESEDERHRDYKREKVLQPTVVRKNWQGKQQDADSEEKEPRYRDRAKERREGKNADYNDSANLLDAVNEDGERAMDREELSKYFGGDEAHTHLVKGLDVALARSAREQKQNNLGDQGPVEGKAETDNFQPASSVEESRKLINRMDMSSTKSNLGRSMLKYLRERHGSNQRRVISTTAAGSAIQRSQLIFSTDFNPQNLALSWEIPSEKSHAGASTQSSSLPKASPLSMELISKIKNVLCRGSLSPDIIKIVPKETQPERSKNEAAPRAVDADDDSEDDIFLSIGD